MLTLCLTRPRRTTSAPRPPPPLALISLTAWPRRTSKWRRSVADPADRPYPTPSEGVVAPPPLPTLGLGVGVHNDAQVAVIPKLAARPAPTLVVTLEGEPIPQRPQQASQADGLALARPAHAISERLARLAAHLTSGRLLPPCCIRPCCGHPLRPDARLLSANRPLGAPQSLVPVSPRVRRSPLYWVGLATQIGRRYAAMGNCPSRAQTGLIVAEKEE